MTPLEAAQIIQDASASIHERLGAVVQTVIEVAADRTRLAIGHQQEGFAPLAASTIAEKAKLGFGPPDYSPLYRTGGYRASIETAREDLTGFSGSSWEGAAWQEFGTAKIPARPVIALGMIDALPFAYEALEAVAGNLLGMEPDAIPDAFPDQGGED